MQTFLRLGKYDEARAAAAEFRDIFGEGNYFLELMEHGLEIESRVRADLLRLAKDLALPLVATNDLHYTRKEDAPAHEVLLCVQSGSTMADPNRFKLDGDDYYLKSPDGDAPGLARAARGLRQHAADRRALRGLASPRARAATCRASRCPRASPSSPGSSRRSSSAWPGAIPAGVSDEMRSRAEYETEVICSKGYAGYFLVVADFINWAKDNGIRVGPGRGSGAGAMTAYAMGITDLDPLQHGLIFERFLNPERMSMPDFDVDFDERRRGEVIRYVTEKYGDDRVAQIVTYGTIKAKQAMKDSARVLGYPYALGDQLTKLMPPAVMGKDIPLGGIFDPHPQALLRGRASSGPATRPTRTRSGSSTPPAGLENLKRQWGVHAAGVIMSSEPLLDVIPIMKREQDGADHHPVRLPELRGARPGQDGLPRPAQPHHPRRRAAQHRGQPRRDASTSTR